MKKMFLNIKKQFKQYFTLARRVNEAITLKNTLKSVFFALLIAIFVMLLPVLLVVNLFIFSHLHILLSVLLVIFILIWVVLYFYFFYTLLKHYHPSIENLNLKRVQWFETMIVSIILLIVSITILSFIF
jgi:hypothetical protein